MRTATVAKASAKLGRKVGMLSRAGRETEDEFLARARTMPWWRPGLVLVKSGARYWSFYERGRHGQSP